MSQLDSVPRWVLGAIALAATVCNGSIAAYRPWHNYAGYLKAELALKRAIDLGEMSSAPDAAMLTSAIDEAYAAVRDLRLEKTEPRVPDAGARSGSNTDG